MKIEMEEMIYETPQVKMIEVEVEKGFAQSENMENPTRGGRSDW